MLDWSDAPSLGDALVEEWCEGLILKFRTVSPASLVLIFEGHVELEGPAASPASSTVVGSHPQAILSSSFVNRLVRRSFAFFASSALFAAEAADFTAAAISFL
jgi:hypothetical protein